MFREKESNQMFFVPGCKDISESNNKWSSVKKYIGESLKREINYKRIFSLEYKEKGSYIVAEVGKREPTEGEIVIMILESPEMDCYFICTENRGTLKGMPFLVGRKEVRVITIF